MCKLVQEYQQYTQAAVEKSRNPYTQTQEHPNIHTGKYINSLMLLNQKRISPENFQIQFPSEQKKNTKMFTKEDLINHLKVFVTPYSTQTPKLLTDYI